MIMDFTLPSSEESPHIAALERAVAAGFRFTSLTDERGSTVTALYAERWCREGVVETIAVRGMEEAIAARIRVEDYPRGDPLWQHPGTVAEVVAELLALPAHGTPGAPRHTRPRSSSLWLPGQS
jgi:hypothetical protein